MCFGRGHPLRTLENRQRSEADERERGTRGRTRCFSFIPLPRIYQRISLFPDKMAQACFICVGGYRSNSHDGATKLPGGSGAVSSKQRGQRLLFHTSQTPIIQRLIAQEQCWDGNGMLGWPQPCPRSNAQFSSSHACVGQPRGELILCACPMLYSFRASSKHARASPFPPSCSVLSLPFLSLFSCAFSSRLLTHFSLPIHKLRHKASSRI